MPSSSLILSVGAVLATLSSTALATKYDKHEVYNSKNWLDAFEFKQDEFNHGYVNYVNEVTAKATKLYKIEGNDVVFGPDGTETLDVNGPGRKSVRLEGKTDYNKGLFILDVKQMPGVCGMWPAFWSLGREPWPVKGEIDIIEGVNDNQVNKITLHTNTNCKVNGLGQTNPQVHNDCALETGGTLGCDVNEVRTNSFGKNFNNIKGPRNSGGGGYYVMEWDSDAIRTWFFPRDQILPATLLSDNPDTSRFGRPAANFQGDCNIDERFKDQRFIFTNNFCGDWAGNVFGSTPGCPLQKDEAGKELSPMDSCKKYVAKNPDVFKNQAWKIGSFRTFKKKPSVTSSPASMSSTSSSASASSTVVSSSSTTVSSSSSSVSSSSSASSSASSSTLVSSSSSVASSTEISSSSAYASSTLVSSPSSSHVVSSSDVSSSSVHVTSSSSASSHSDHTTSSSVASSSSVESSSSIVSSSSEHFTSSSSTDASASSATLSSSVAHVTSSTDVHITATSSDLSSTSSTAASSVDVHSSSSIEHASVSSSAVSSTIDGHSSLSTDNASVSSSASSSVNVHGSSSTELASASSSEAPASTSSIDSHGQSSSTLSSSSSGSTYSAGSSSSSSSSASAYYYGGDSAASSSASGYGDKAPSTSCTTSSAKATSSAPVHLVHSESAPTYGDNHASYPVSSIKKNDYPYLPEFNSATPIYPAPTSVPAHGTDKPKPSHTITTTYTTTYVDVCETGYITKTTTFAVTYALTATSEAGKPVAPPAYGWDVTTKVCDKGCGNGPKTVTVTVPCTKCNYIATPTPELPAGKPTPAVPEAHKTMPAVPAVHTPTPMIPDSETITTKIYQTKIITLSKVPAPAASQSKPAEVPAASKPVVPAYGTGVPAKPAGNNGTMSVGTGVKPVASKTGYAPPIFTGAAAGMQVGDVVGLVAVAVAMVL